MANKPTAHPGGLFIACRSPVLKYGQSTGVYTMSNLASWSYAEGPLTVWPASGTDEWGVPIGGEPYLIPAIDYIEGGEVGVDANGSEFTPELTVWFEAEPDSGLVPEREWYIKPGDHTAITSAPVDAERVRSVSGYPMKKFGANQIQDWEIKT